MTPLAENDQFQNKIVDRLKNSELSNPLYVATYLGSLASLAGINSVVNNTGLSITSNLLLLLGFLFSFACRKYRFPVNLVNGIALVLGTLLLIQIATGAMSVESIFPEARGQTDLKTAIVLEWFLVLYSWVLLDDRRVVFASIGSAAIIGLVAAYDLNTDLVVYFIIYVFATIFMLIHQNYLLHKNWGRSVSSSSFDIRLIMTQLALTFATGLGVIVAGLILVTPIQAGLKSLSLGNALKSLVSLGNPSASNLPNNKSDSFSDDTSVPIGIGGNFSDQSEIVMRAYPSDHQDHYWRGRTYDQYTSNGWNSTITDPRVVYNIQESMMTNQQFITHRLANIYADSGVSNTVPRSEFITKFVQLGGDTSTLYTPSYPVSLSFPRNFAGQLSVSRDGEIGSDLSISGLTYVVGSAPPVFNLGDLESASEDSLDPSYRTLFIDQGPDTYPLADRNRLEQIVQGIEASLPPNHRTVFDRAEAIRRWVANRCIYSLDVDSVPPGQDAITYFLFNSRRGYCDLFASSMVILCRMDNIPARYVTGFAPGQRRQEDQGFDIEVKDKHAWCEVFFPGLGWYPFEATAGSVAEAARPHHGPSHIWTDLYARAQNFVKLHGILPVILIVVALLGLIWVIKVEVLDRLLRRAPTINGRRRNKVVYANRVNTDNTLEDNIAVKQAVVNHWFEVTNELDRWFIEQMPWETTREFCDRVDGIIIAAQANGKNGQPMPSKEAALLGLSRLCDDILAAKYAADDDPLKSLVQRYKIGAGDKDVANLVLFIRWARTHTKRSKSDRVYYADKPS